MNNSPKWIDVFDKPPKDNETVLIAADWFDNYGDRHQYVTLGTYFSFADKWVSECGDELYHPDISDLCLVYTWMPLPSPPERVLDLDDVDELEDEL